jgi:hypothetical protein
LISSTFQHVRYFQLSTLQDYNIFNISAFNSSTSHHFKHLNSGASKLSSILVPGVVDRWAVDRWWHKYCLYSFPMKVKTRNAFKRSQGLQSPEAPKGCVCVRTGYTACMVSGARYMRLCPNHGGTKAYVSNLKQASKTRNASKKQEIICGGSPAGLDG